MQFLKYKHAQEAPECHEQLQVHRCHTSGMSFLSRTTAVFTLEYHLNGKSSCEKALSGQQIEISIV